MSQYDLIPRKQKRQGVRYLRSVIISLLALIVISVAIMIGTLPEEPDMTLAPEATVTPTESVLRYAWIEGRDTCPESPEYKKQVVHGANLWKSPEMKTKPELIPHGAAVGVLDESEEWVHVDYAGKTGYVQSYLIVDYDPLKDFRAATGERYCLLCTLTCTSEKINTAPTAMSF